MRLSYEDAVLEEMLTPHLEQERLAGVPKAEMLEDTHRISTAETVSTLYREHILFLSGSFYCYGLINTDWVKL